MMNSLDYFVWTYNYICSIFVIQLFSCRKRVNSESAFEDKYDTSSIKRPEVKKKLKKIESLYSINSISSTSTDSDSSMNPLDFLFNNNLNEKKKILKSDKRNITDSPVFIETNSPIITRKKKKFYCYCSVCQTKIDLENEKNRILPIIYRYSDDYICKSCYLKKVNNLTNRVCY